MRSDDVVVVNCRISLGRETVSILVMADLVAVATVSYTPGPRRVHIACPFHVVRALPPAGLGDETDRSYRLGTSVLSSALKVPIASLTMHRAQDYTSLLYLFRELTIGEERRWVGTARGKMIGTGERAPSLAERASSLSIRKWS